MMFGSERNPKGPAWRRLQTVEKDLSGTRMRFKVPPIRPPEPFDNEDFPLFPDSLDLSDPAIYQDFKNADPDNGISFTHVWVGDWKFTGRPILDGDNVGDLAVGICVLDISDQPVNHSLFQREELVDFTRRFREVKQLNKYHRGHPEECSPYDLTSFFELDTYQWPSHLNPINSQWLERNGTEWLYFENQPLRDGSNEFYWLTPIGHQHCLEVRFAARTCLHNAGNPYRSAIRSPLTNYRRLMENIMDTLVVELSGEARKERASIHNSDSHYPLPHCSEQLVKEAKHTLYMWSDKGYWGEKGQNPEEDDLRAPKEDVAAFIDERIKPRPLPRCLAIGPAFIEEERAVREDVSWNITGKPQICVRP